jgi:AcrR family transcriptional regulator
MRKSPVKRAPQERGKKTRELLLLAAIKSLAESNIFGLRYSQISKIAKVPQPLLDYHFPSVEALLTEMVAHELEKLKVLSLEAIQKHMTKPRKALEAYIRAPLELAAKDSGFRAVWSCYYHLTTVHKHFSDYNRTVRRIGNERIVALLIAILHHEGKAKYATKTKLLSEVATTIQGIITGYGFMGGTETGGDLSEMADLAVKASAQILAANFP